MVNSDEHGMGNSNCRTVFASCGSYPLILSRKIKIFHIPGWLCALNQNWFQDFVVFPCLRFPALWWFPGQTPAQEEIWAALGNRFMSVPISTRMTSALCRPIPGSSSISCIVSCHPYFQSQLVWFFISCWKSNIHGRNTSLIFRIHKNSANFTLFFIFSTF